MLILKFSPNTNSQLSFKLIKACKITAVMFKINHKLVKKIFKVEKTKNFRPTAISKSPYYDWKICKI